ncbi:unnamed protein product [Ceutorhynchus assimilis]|uniref:Uncharacterized protein n=1 Tax=Ceutorhynchus assimilis TaxID=467358 RepID=A0A9N9ML18_9CUCU|nr:unnamed protein product [Ceutorhynchus assimilis]
MDSFYDAPRRPPTPIARETLSAEPVVPEISVLCTSNNAPRNTFTSYNQWKHHQNNFLGPNKENVNSCVQQPQNSSILKKHVRFENPVLQQKPPDILKPLNLYQNNKGGKQALTFQQIYMGNVPSRQLDLSIMDFPKKVSPIKNKKVSLSPTKPQKKETPKTYKEFMETQKKPNDIVFNDSVTDIFHYNNSKTKQKITEHHNHTKPQQNIAEQNNIQSHPAVQENNFERVARAYLQRQSPQNDQIQNIPQDFFQRQSPQNHQTQNKPQGFFKNQQPTSNDGFESHDFPMYSCTYQSQSQNNEMPRYSQNETREKLPSTNIQRTEINTPTFKQNFSEHQRVFDKDHVPKNKESPKTCVCCSETPKHPNNKADDDLSTKDLLKIIAQQSQQITNQNSQILLLQQQVTELVSMQKNNEIYRQRMVETGHCCQRDGNSYQKKIPIEQPNDNFLKNGYVQEECITSTQREIFNEVEANKNKNNQMPFSIGLTTSFEVSFRRPNNRAPNDIIYQQRNPKLLDLESETPKIQEITETESTKSDRYDAQQVNAIDNNKGTLVDTSMVFKEPIQVRESCPSPEPSIKINMNDFDESESDEEDSSQVEVSFYRNLMSQVNKILQRAQIDTGEDFGTSKLNNKTIHKVKEATMKHLKRIGIDMPNFEESPGSNSSSEDLHGQSYDQDDISFAVKQLLMKYLPADHLSKLAATAKADARLTPKEKVGAIKNRPEFSFATVEYMKKYNLIANNQKDFNKVHKQTSSKQSPKILDISKLKQQPKLL